MNSKYIKIAFLLVLSILTLHFEKAHSNNLESGLEINQEEDKKVSGKVVDETGEGVSGASIIVKGTTEGTVSDIEGNYELQVPEDGTIVVSFIGYYTQEIIVGNRFVVDVTLVPDAQQLEEVVVVGYGTQRKSDVTGSVASVKAATLQRIPLARADESLQGQVAGVLIQNNDASPNADISIRIRGVSSINGGNNPLVIVDGIQGTNLRDIHPNDIASIEVLKDASATAIYGSRGASGVILVTTKAGKSGKPVVTYSGYGSVSQVRKKLDFMNAGEYATVINANRLARSLPAVFTDEEIANFNQTEGTDWQDEIFRNAYLHNHHVNISGGSDKISYSISGDYLKTEGVVINSSFEKYSFRPNFVINISEKLKLTLNTFASWSTDHPILLNSRDREGSPIYAASLFAPTKPVFEDDGSYSQPGGGYGPNTEYNPLALASEPIRDNLEYKFFVSPVLEYEIIDGLKISTSASHQLVTNNDGRYINEGIVNGDESDRQASVYNNRWNSFQNTNIVSYEKEFDDHRLKFTGVYETQRQVNDERSGSGSNFLTNAVSYNRLDLAKLPGVPFSERTEQTLRSFMGRVNYSFDERYLITLTGRRDESSVFAKNNKSAFFPSVAFGWNVTNETFLKSSQLIDNLKVRASYGMVGNQAIRPYQSLSKFAGGSNFSFDGGSTTTGLNLDPQAPNDDLKWESTTQLNFGVDLELLSGKLSLVADYYQKNTTDLLLSRALLRASGFQTQLVNAGEVENKGIELYLSGYPIQSDDFTWHTGLTLAKNKNKVVDLNDGETEIPLGGAGLPGFSDAVWIEKGKSIGQIRGYEYVGIWKSDETILAGAYEVTPGSPKYVDQNNDGLIDENDIVDIANTLPDYTFGWNNTFSYKNFDLNILVQGVQGNDIYNIGRSRIESNDTGVSPKLLNVWSVDNEDADVPGHNALGGNRNDSRWVEDGSYLRVKNISLGYTLPSSIIEPLGVSSVRIYATGTNLLTFTDYSGYDPEANNAREISPSRGAADPYAGIDHATFPSQKKYTLSLDIKF